MLGRDRTLLAAALAGIVVLAWAYLLSGAGMDMSMPGMVMAPTAWSPATAALMFAMWWIMMIAMMVPGAAPAILLFSTLSRRQDAASRPSVRGAMFLAGYLAIWALFSVAATALQWGLERLDAMAMDMSVASRALGGAILIGGGLYQFAPVKHACLQECQNPILFFSRHWRSGAAGAFRMGTVHGTYCVGCCWFLMGLLFVAGVMNPLWIAGLSLYVALEKLIPGAPWLGRAAGATLMLGGILLIAASFA